MQISLTPEQVDTLVREAILQSGLVKTIEGAIAKALGGYDSPVDKAVKDYVSVVLRDLLKTHYKEQVEAAVRAAIDARLTKEILDTVAEAAIQKIERAAEGRY
jgi:hypothetical protein